MPAFPEYVLDGIIASEQIRPDRLIIYGLCLRNGQERELMRFRASMRVLEEAGARAAGRVAIFFMDLPEGREAWSQAGMVRLVRTLMAECPHFLYFAAPTEAALKPVLFCLSGRRLRVMISAASAYGRRVGGATLAQRTINLARQIEYLNERPGQAKRGSAGPGMMRTPYDL